MRSFGGGIECQENKLDCASKFDTTEGYKTTWVNHRGMQHVLNVIYDKPAMQNAAISLGCLNFAEYCSVLITRLLLHLRLLVTSTTTEPTWPKSHRFISQVVNKRLDFMVVHRRL